jgi:hypothetical protein
VTTAEGDGWLRRWGEPSWAKRISIMIDRPCPRRPNGEDLGPLSRAHSMYEYSICVRGPYTVNAMAGAVQFSRG